MALDPNELRSEETRTAYPRIHPDMGPGAVATKEFAAIVAETLLPVGLPVAYNTSTNKWVPWDADGSNGTDTMKGIVYPEAIQTDGTNSVLGNVMLKGQAHYDDIWAAVNSLGLETADDLKTELRSGPRSIGIAIQGLTQVR